MAELVGRIVKSLPKQSGKGAKGDWTRYQVLVETEGPHPKQVVIDIYNDKIAPLRGAQVGTPVRFQYDLNSREYKGNYYTSVTAYKLELVNDAVSTAKAQPQRKTTYEREPVPVDEDESNSLPF